MQIQPRYPNVLSMALLKYIRQNIEASSPRQMHLPLTEKDLKAANKEVRECIEGGADSCKGQPQTTTTRGKYFHSKITQTLNLHTKRNVCVKCSLEPI